MDESLVEDITQVTVEENSIITEEAIFQMKHNKAQQNSTKSFGVS